MLEEKTKAPEFELPDDRGEKISLSSFKGKKVLLYFYPRDETPGCTKEACNLRDNFEAFKAKGAVIIGVSPDSPESHVTFRERHGMQFHLLSDPKHEAMEAYGAWGEKFSFGTKHLGVKRISYLIDEEGRIAKAFTKVDTAAHAAQVLPFL